MQKILFPLLLSILVVFVGFFGWSTYQYYQAIHSDDPITPYLAVNSGSVTIGRGDIAIDMIEGENYNVQEGDILITKDSTLAVLHWPDHSTTRIGEDSRMTIKRMRVTEDYSAIEIELTLESGKIWNNIVRTIYPGSYFRARLPENNVIAGVRGTVFAINLDKNYIHSVDHSVALSDGLGRTVTLLPGDVVEARDIMKRLGKTILDSAWVQVNMAHDMADNILHSSQVEKSLNLLRQADTLWDRFVRWVLSFFSAFQDIEILESIVNMNSADMVDIPKEHILKWYQRFQDTKFVQERDTIRLLVQKTWTSGDDYIDTIVRGAIWDKMSFSGLTLAGTDALLANYTKTVDAKIQSVLKMVPVSELQDKAKETLRLLVK